MKSSWLKDALSEIDSTCDAVTVICNPPQKVARGKVRGSDPEDSFFRIEAKSMRGSVEVNMSLHISVALIICFADGLP